LTSTLKTWRWAATLALIVLSGVLVAKGHFTIGLGQGE
jgi:hypothetical protein